MIVVAIDKLKQAQLDYPAASQSLRGWYQILTKSNFSSEGELRVVFGDMRGFNYDFKFPIPSCNLIVQTFINFESQVAYIEQIRAGNQ